MSSHHMNSPKTNIAAPIDTDTGIIVRAEQRSDWLRALDRAFAEELTAVRTGGSMESDYTEETEFRVRSGENTYTVAVVRFSSPVDGLTTIVRCQCAAGKNERICKHAALSVKLANAYPFSTKPERTDEQSRLDRIGMNLLIAPKWRRT